MALASEDEWESDPELKAMRAEFVASFAERRKALETHAAALARESPGSRAWGEASEGARGVAHKLAGAAETYGFPTLTLASSALEELLETGREPAQAALWTGLLSEMLAAAQRRGKDCGEFADDPRLKSLKLASQSGSPD
jgi:HPt (histidine-containing phosphotransfer) domain-containing protein